MRLSGLSARRWPALQQETWAKSHWFRAEGEENWSVCLQDAQAMESELAVFIRTVDCWTQTGKWVAAATTQGRLLQLDTTEAVAGRRGQRAGDQPERRLQ